MSSSWPKIDNITEVKMYNPSTNENEPLQKIDFKGIADIFDHDDINERRRDDWIVRGFSAVMEYKGDNYDVTIAGNNVMGYVKVADIASYDHGE